MDWYTLFSNAGSLLTVFGQATFTSARSIEVEVIVECEYFRKGDSSSTHRERTADAFFTYVCIGKDGKTKPLPQLKVVFALVVPWEVTQDGQSSRYMITVRQESSAGS